MNEAFAPLLMVAYIPYIAAFQSSRRINKLACGQAFILERDMSETSSAAHTARMAELQPSSGELNPQPGTGSPIPQELCNTTDTTLPNNLPPGWCLQGPVQQVSLLYDKSLFLLKNDSNRTKRAVIRRTLLNGKLEDFTFDVNYWGATDQIFWAGKTDRGTLELLSVAESPDDDLLNGLVHIRMDEEPPGYIWNRWSVPVYVSVDTTHAPPGTMSFFRRVLGAGQRLVFGYDATDQLEWRAAVLQRHGDLSTPWPPAP